MQESGRRPWLIPLVFAVVILSLPLQIVVANRVSEPFPGLFFPAFRTVHKMSADGLKFREATFLVNGTTPIEAEELFGIAEANRVRWMSKRYFPRKARGPVRLAPAMRATLVRNISRTTNDRPHILTVIWKQRRFDVKTGRVFDVRSDPAYDVPLSGPA